MAKGSLLLQAVLQFFNNSGQVLNGGKLYFYSPSTTTPKNTYTDNTKGVANPNPVILDSAGRPDNNGTPINIYLDGSYKLVVKDSADNTIRTVDPVNTLGQLINTRTTSSNTSIAETDRDYIVTVDASAGNKTVTLLAAATAGAGFRFGVQKLDSSVNTVTIDANSSETINGALTFVIDKQYNTTWFTSDGTQWIGEVNATFPNGITVTGNGSVSGNLTVGGTLGVTGATTLSSTLAVTGVTTLSNALNEKQGADIASATTTDIGAATGNYVKVTGTTTITGLGTIQNGTERTVEFTGALILTHNATSLILPGAANITTVAGDTATFRSEGSGNWRCISYNRGAALRLYKVNRQVFTSTGTYTPTAGTAYCDIEVLGAGGGSGGVVSSGSGNTNSTGGGGAGEYARGLFAVSTVVGAGTTAAVTIGAAGTAGSSGAPATAGGNGGNTTVVANGGSGSTVISANGGSGSAAGTTSGGIAFRAGGAGGSGGSNGDFRLTGQSGFQGLDFGSTASLGKGGAGGSTIYGAGGSEVSGSSAAVGTVGTGYGSGGGGAFSIGTQATQGGAVGKAGIAIIYEYIA